MGRRGRTFSHSLVGWFRESYSVHIFRADRPVGEFCFSNRMLLLFILLVTVSVSGAFFLSGTGPGTRDADLARAERLQANLNLLEDEVGVLEQAYGDFRKGITAAFKEMPVSHARYDSLDGEDENTGSRSVESRLLGMRQGISEAMEYLGEFGSMMRTRQEILEYIPNKWPVEGGGGKRLSMEFGPNIHPIRNFWYLHQGVDIAGGGTVVASASGRVTKIGSMQDSEYGNYVEVEHRFGFTTKYAHLGRIYVREGQKVVAGDNIGTMGSTGVSTGTHLHFEIRLGKQVLDPASFLKISTDFGRWTGDRN